MDYDEFYLFVQNSTRKNIENLLQISEQRKKDTLELNANEDLIATPSKRKYPFAVMNYNRSITTKNVSFFEGFDIALSLAYEIATTSREKLDPKHHGFYTIIQNGLNGLIYSFVTATHQYYNVPNIYIYIYIIVHNLRQRIR